MQCPHCFREINTAGACPFCGYEGSGQAKRYPLALRPGSILNGRYILGHVLGQGGFGITYIAQDYRTKERVAIKEYFPAEFAGRASGTSVQIHSEDQAENFAYGKAQFLEEAKTLAAFIGNTNIVRIYSYFEENNTAYLCMEYVDGLPLNKYMAGHGGRLSSAEANRLLLPLMEALGQVHAKGIVHRDIAPDNILVDQSGTAKLIDFGAARYSTGEKSRSLDVILKHGFAPYEQYMRRGRQGPWTDVYALAATYYYAITGRVPPEAVERREEDTLIPPNTLGAKLSPAQEDVLLKALEVNASERFRSMAAFHQAMLEASPDARETERRLEHERRERGLRAEPERREEEARREAERLEQERQEREVGKAAKRTEKAAADENGKKPKLLLILAAAAVLALIVFGVTRFTGGASETPAVTSVPSAVKSEATAAAAEIPPPAPEEPAARIKVGMVTDIGGINDQSFNQLAWEGLTALAAGDSRFEVEYLESRTDADYQTNINTFIEEDCDLVICVGYMLADATRAAAEANPDQKFAVIDDSLCADLPNVACLMFAQEQASYLVGLVAGSVTRSNTVGYVQGMVSDSMNLYGIGYITGVLEVCPDATILQYNANNFGDIADGNTVAKIMITKGADVIYQAAGGTGIGVLNACGEKGIWGIGVDIDQAAALGNDHIITSAVKRVDIASQDISRAVADGKFTAGVHRYDLSNGGVDLAPTRTHIPEDVLKLVEAAKADIAAGRKTVPTTAADCPMFTLG